MRRLLLASVLALVSALGATAAATAATRECDGLQICVPVAGPWVVVGGGGQAGRSVDFQLDCPRGYVVGGLDAELSDQQIQLTFAGTLGSPVNPGITTARSAVFTGTYVGGDPRARPSFRPHIGCIPAAGGGGRTPTSVVKTFPPGNPVDRHVKNLRVLGSGRVRQPCAAGERLIDASDAVGFFTSAPPTVAQIGTVRATLTGGNAGVTVAVHATRAAARAGAILQVAVDCAGGR